MAAYTDPQYYGEQYLRQMGYTGSFGAGEAMPWLAADPSRRSAYDAAMAANPGGAWAPITTPTGPVISQEAKQKLQQVLQNANAPAASTYNDPRYAGEYLTRLMNYGGDFGSGGGNQWLQDSGNFGGYAQILNALDPSSANPAGLALNDNTRTNLDQLFENYTRYGKPTVPGYSDLTDEQKRYTDVARAMGIFTEDDEFAIDGYLGGILDADPQLKAQFIDAVNDPYAGGVESLFVEDLHDWEKEALLALSNSVGSGSEYMDQIQGTLDSLKSYLERATAPMTDEEFQASIDRYMDPYTQNVLESTIKNITQEGEEARARIIASMGGRDSSSAGVQLSQLDKNVQDLIAQASGDILSTGFSNAANLAKGFYDTESNASTQAANILTQLPDVLSRAGSTERDFAISDLKNKLSAGAYVRDQNQRLLDAVSGEYNAERSYEQDMIKFLTSILGQLPTQGQQGTVTSEPDLLSRLSAGGRFLSGVDFSKVFS